MTDLTILLHDGLGVLTAAWSCRRIPCPHGAPHEVTVLHFPPRLSSPSQWGDAEGPQAFRGLLFSAESRRNGMSTPRIW